MKAFILLLSLLLTNEVSFAANKCSAKAESYLKNVGNTQPATLIEQTQEGFLIYEVRTNNHGGDAAYEVVVDTKCKLISTRLIWSE